MVFKCKECNIEISLGDTCGDGLCMKCRNGGWTLSTNKYDNSTYNPNCTVKLICSDCGEERGTDGFGSLCGHCSRKTMENISLAGFDGAVDAVNSITNTFNTPTLDVNDGPEYDFWEYKVIDREDLAGEKGINKESIEDTLNELGDEGWELISLEVNTNKGLLYILKRML